MLCQNCHKNEATFHLKEVTKGKVQALHLCQDCAASQGLTQKGTGGIDLAALIYNITSENLKLDSPEAPADIGRDAESGVGCPICGLTFDTFRRQGRLGCPRCYDTFREMLSPLLAAMHRGSEHRGKTPATPRASSTSLEHLEIEKLEEELARMIAVEAYERAAEIRDKINHITAPKNK